MKLFTKLKFKVKEEQFVLIIVVLILIALIATVFIWTYNRQKVLLQNDLEDKARVITTQMNAMRHFIAKNQRKINYSKGVYEYKNLNPEKVAAEVADILNISTNYKIKLAAAAAVPRNPHNKPDNFETRQMVKFGKDKNLQEVFEKDFMAGKEYYRYVKPLYMSKHCVDCHGEPKGQPDKTGHPKEGFKIGDLTGLLTVSVPSDSMNVILKTNAKSLFLFLLVVGFITIASVYFVTRRLIVLTRHVENINNLLSAKNEDLMRLEKAKSDLTHMIVHDFRGTLANIMGYLSLLIDEQLGELNNSQKEFTEAALINSKKLLNMAADLLDINKMEEDRMPLSVQVVDLNEVFEEKKDFWSKSAALENKTIDVEMDKNAPKINTDRNILERILDNLVYNAIKHTVPGKGKLKVLCEFDKKERKILFKVKDNGEGISKDYLEKVFDKFFQVEAVKSKKVMGVGLGLTFCKMAVEALGGRIYLESEVGKGTTAVVVLSA